MIVKKKDPEKIVLKSQAKPGSKTYKTEIKLVFSFYPLPTTRSK